MRVPTLGSLVFVLAAACTAPTPPEPPVHIQATHGAAPTQTWIVVFRPGAGDPGTMAAALITQYGGGLRFTYRHALRGFAADLEPEAVALIRRDPSVAWVERDGPVHITETQPSPPSWGLDRVDQRDLPLDASYTFQNRGAGVRVYIIDTGIWFPHLEYGGRAVSGYDFIDNDPDASDCHGHGTHVAGTVGGSTVGIAKDVTLIAVRVLNCSGSGQWSQVIAGVDWVVAQGVLPAVANMSLGGGKNDAMNLAVNNAVAAGVVFAVAAGNSGGDACLISPASAADALTVGATGIGDYKPSWSSYGLCLDLFAPGEAITSSTQNGGYGTWSGTSMATPHVAGVAALYLAFAPAATPAAVRVALVGGATPDHVTSPGAGSPNLLLYSLIAGAPPPPVVVHVGDLDGSAVAKPNGNSPWTVTVAVEAHDANHLPISGVLVSGTLGSCTTSGTGRCTITRRVRGSSATFSVLAMRAPYDGAANHDPDGDSDGTTITVARP